MQIGFLFDADADPDADSGYQNDEDPRGSGSTTLLYTIVGISLSRGSDSLTK
jgi:hypothetical protein